MDFNTSQSPWFAGWNNDFSYKNFNLSFRKETAKLAMFLNLLALDIFIECTKADSIKNSFQFPGLHFPTL